MLIKRQPLEAGPVVELTPVIDIVFLLLIFFLVATTFSQEERQIPIALPGAASSQPISMALREIVITVEQAGTITLSGREVSLDELGAVVSDAVGVNPQQKVSVRGDKDAPYGLVASVLDVCRTSGVDEPFLDTAPLP